MLYFCTKTLPSETTPSTDPCYFRFIIFSFLLMFLPIQTRVILPMQSWQAIWYRIDICEFRPDIFPCSFQEGQWAATLYWDWETGHSIYMPIPLWMSFLISLPVGTENQGFETPRKEFLLFFYCSFLNFRPLGSNSNFPPNFNLYESSHPQGGWGKNGISRPAQKTTVTF